MMVDGQGHVALGASTEEDNVVIQNNDASSTSVDVSFRAARSANVVADRTIRLRAGWSNGRTEQSLAFEQWSGTEWMESIVLQGNGRLGVGVPHPMDAIDVAGGAVLRQGSLLFQRGAVELDSDDTGAFSLTTGGSKVLSVLPGGREFSCSRATCVIRNNTLV